MIGYKCTTCGAAFRSISAFDGHRTGSYEQRDQRGNLITKSGRHCLSTVEMEQRGFVCAPNGLWRVAGWHLSNTSNTSAEAPRIAHRNPKITPHPGPSAEDDDIPPCKTSTGPQSLSA